VDVGLGLGVLVATGMDVGDCGVNVSLGEGDSVALGV
jgi:hypothetical protein